MERTRRQQRRRQSIPATELLGILNVLNEDARLKDVLGDPPARGLVVSVTEGAVSIEIAPGVRVDDQGRATFRDALADARARAAEEARLSGRSPASVERRPDARAGPRPHILTARSHLDAGNPGRALEVIEAALARRPQSVDLHTYRALSLTALGEHEQAVGAYRRVIQLDAQNAFAHAGAAQLLVKLGRWSEVLAHANAGLSLSADDPLMLHALALANEHLGLYEEAADALKRALEIDPRLPNGQEDLRRIKLALEQDVEITLSAPEETPGPATDAPVETQCAPADTASANASESDDEERRPPSDGALDARWGVASRRSREGAGVRCDKCNTENPPRISYCIECGEKLGN